jgi:hypothetical protein
VVTVFSGVAAFLPQIQAIGLHGKLDAKSKDAKEFKIGKDHLSIRFVPFAPSRPGTEALDYASDPVCMIGTSEIPFLFALDQPPCYKVRMQF